MARRRGGRARGGRVVGQRFRLVLVVVPAPRPRRSPLECLTLAPDRAESRLGMPRAERVEWVHHIVASRLQTIGDVAVARMGTVAVIAGDGDAAPGSSTRSRIPRARQRLRGRNDVARRARPAGPACRCRRPRGVDARTARRCRASKRRHHRARRVREGARPQRRGAFRGECRRGGVWRRGLHGCARVQFRRIGHGPGAQAPGVARGARRRA